MGCVQAKGRVKVYREGEGTKDGNSSEVNTPAPLHQSLTTPTIEKVSSLITPINPILGGDDGPVELTTSKEKKEETKIIYNTIEEGTVTHSIPVVPHSDLPAIDRVPVPFLVPDAVEIVSEVETASSPCHSRSNSNDFFVQSTIMTHPTYTQSVIEYGNGGDGGDGKMGGSLVGSMRALSADMGSNNHQESFGEGRRPLMKARKRSFKEVINTAVAVPLINEEQGDLIRINQYIIESHLGSGSYGVVSKVYIDFVDDSSKASGARRYFAMKQVDKKRLMKKRMGRKGSAMDMLKQEIAVWKKVKHINCLTLIEVIDDPADNNLYMISEYAEGGSTMGDSLENQPLSIEEAKSTFYQLMLGIQYLHSNMIVHHDIKPGNILFTDDKTVKIADFGLAEIAEVDISEKTVGTAAFMSPDMVSGLPYQSKDADIWACGITLYTLVYGHVPFMHSNLLDLYDMIQTMPLPLNGESEKVKVTDEKLLDLLTKMLEKDPSVRLTNIEEILSHPWLQEESCSSKYPSLPQTPSIRELLTEADIQQAYTNKWTMTGILAAKRVSKILTASIYKKNSIAGGVDVQLRLEP
jgi:serine/threonine protein kinase